ncbi:hypothetical protein SOPP22_12005 [Shewanella sp. OPT22]|nr:hypothetical protein SOPP22_12005 [Shewanella sp. OPT22]
MKLFIQTIVFITSIIVTFVFAYNQALKDSASDFYFIDASKTFITLKLFREKGNEKTISFLESELDSLIEINRTLAGERSIYFEYLNFQLPMDYGYYEKILEYRSIYPLKNTEYSTVENLNWLVSNANKPINKD